ncbi:hypothetical protein [Bradyrhizobium sp. CCBAU 65884]|uniref:hypothetical protein n=1 Tax=Bradyrhizobium sp. CCBAU 65884 TaxID=722477 RepID=UPI002306DB63|nr:hypothetical protein [Bradyrhizobium sp. CCBAU 65884]
MRRRHDRWFFLAAAKRVVDDLAGEFIGPADDRGDRDVRQHRASLIDGLDHVTGIDELLLAFEQARLRLVQVGVASRPDVGTRCRQRLHIGLDQLLGVGRVKRQMTAGASCDKQPLADSRLFTVDTPKNVFGPLRRIQPAELTLDINHPAQPQARTIAQFVVLGTQPISYRIDSRRASIRSGCDFHYGARGLCGE